MLKKVGKTEVVISVLALFTVIAITFAAFTERLTITGSATAKAAVWKIEFGSVSSPILTGSAKEITSPTIDKTTIKKFSFEFDGENDSIAYVFYVGNNGTLDAKIQAIDFPKPVCTGQDGLGDENYRGDLYGKVDEGQVCPQLSTSLKYTEGAKSGQDVQVGDTLKAGESARMKFEFAYRKGTASSPHNDVRISSVDLTITYVQT